MRCEAEDRKVRLRRSEVRRFSLNCWSSGLREVASHSTSTALEGRYEKLPRLGTFQYHEEKIT